MKKLFCLVLALLMSYSFAAMAESAPSKTTADMVRVESLEIENLPVGAIAPHLRVGLVGMANAQGTVTEALMAKYQKAIDRCQLELQKLAASKLMTSYFGQIRDIHGALVSLEDWLGTKELRIFEFEPIVVENYDLSYGYVTTIIRFSTPFQKDQQLVVLIGVTKDGQDEPIEWVALDGTVVEGMEYKEEGDVQLTIPAELMMSIQENLALMAVISK